MEFQPIINEKHQTQKRAMEIAPLQTMEITPTKIILIENSVWMLRSNCLLRNCNSALIQGPRRRIVTLLLQQYR